MSTLSWEIFKKDLSKDTVLLRFDMIDQGQSSKVDFQYTQELQVDVLDHLIDFIDSENINLVGISYGASVALQYTIKHQDKVKRLFLANGVAKTSPWLKDIGDGWNQVGKTRDGLMYYNITIPYIYSPTFYTKNIKWMEDRKKVLIPIFSNPTFLDAMERLTISAETHDTVSALHTINTKTFILSSELDFLTPVYEQKFLHENIKGSTLKIIPNCGHASMYEIPQEFKRLILDFVHDKK